MRKIGWHHTDGGDLLALHHLQGQLGLEILQHHGLGAAQGRGKVGQRAGRATGVRRDRHGDVVPRQLP
jgi:hypothetical protein